MSLVAQIAKECLRAGRPLDELVTELVEKEYADTLHKTKEAVRAGVSFDSVRDSLVADGFLPKVAAALFFTAQEEVATQLADENLLQKATQAAINLYRNGVREDSVVGHLKSIGAANIAEKVAADNKKYYRP